MASSSSSSRRQRLYNNDSYHNNNKKKNPSLRLLCLHDANSNARSLQIKLQKFGDRLLENHNIELVYVNAPLVMNHHDDDDDNKNDDNENNSNSTTDDASQRSWWQTTEEHTYLGLDASLLMLKHIWNSWSSFSGIIGVGQGAAIGAMLTLWLFEGGDGDDAVPVAGGGGSSRAPPQSAIFVDGFTVLPDDVALLSIQRLEVLHILSTEITYEQQQQGGGSARFVTHMGGRTHVRPVGQVWYSTDCLNRMGRYLVQQKLSHQSTVVAVAQQALVATEQRAAHLVQRHAMARPPPSLMAVIGPANSVSGWSGPKRNLPAGGAPCPADFVLPIHQRNHGHVPETTAVDENKHLYLPG